MEAKDCPMIDEASKPSDHALKKLMRIQGFSFLTA
jgi:hypothetical protein